MSKPKRAVFAFSACPITDGHIDIVHRAAKVFDEIIIAIPRHVNKGDADRMFNDADRFVMAKVTFADEPNVTNVVFIETTTIDICKKYNARFLIRGIRDYTDLNYEYKLAYLNRKISVGVVDTFFVPGDPTLSMFSSTTVRELIKLKNPTWKEFVPKCVIAYIENIIDCECVEKGMGGLRFKKSK